MTNKTVGIFTACSSERHLTEPIHKELKELGINSHYITIAQNNILRSYYECSQYIKSIDYDFILSVADRPEQIGATLAAFHNKIPIGHLYAGDHNTIATYDDIHRHAISLYSNIQFCSCIESVENTMRLMRSAGLIPNANYVGATHFDNIDLLNIDNFGLTSKKPYILILINSETIGNDKKLVEDTHTKFMSLCTNGIPNVIIAKSNNDSEELETSIFNIIRKRVNTEINIVRENRANHEYFISLIKNCDYFITNSSAVIYEAPMLLEEKRIIHIGNRNKRRTKIPKSSHDGLASYRTALLIKTFLEGIT